LAELSFTRGKANWGYAFRFGLLKVTDDDMDAIAHAMRAAEDHRPVPSHTGLSTTARRHLEPHTPSTMRRADRLFQIVQLIRGRRLSTAQFLAQRLEVSERTVYRDVAELMVQGVPIEGEAGVGYRMRSGFDLPPLMFTHEEAQALVASVRIAQPRLDRTRSAGRKRAVEDPRRAARGGTCRGRELAVYAPPIEFDPGTRARLEPLRLAAEGAPQGQPALPRPEDSDSERTVRPLGCFYWGACGRSRPGAKPAKGSAASASTASSSSTYWTKSSATSRQDPARPVPPNGTAPTRSSGLSDCSSALLIRPQPVDVHQLAFLGVRLAVLFARGHGPQRPLAGRALA
jgi:biotin operon repressor